MYTDEEDHLSINALKQLLSSIGMYLEPKQERILEEKARDISGNADASSNFADFLKIMHYMLETDFANLNYTTETLARRMRKSLTMEPSSSHTPECRTLRRSSV